MLHLPEQSPGEQPGSHCHLCYQQRNLPGNTDKLLQRFEVEVSERKRFEELVIWDRINACVFGVLTVTVTNDTRVVAAQSESLWHLNIDICSRQWSQVESHFSFYCMLKLQYCNPRCTRL